MELQKLKEVFGFTDFRPFQKEVIEEVNKNRDTIWELEKRR